MATSKSKSPSKSSRPRRATPRTSEKNLLPSRIGSIVSRLRDLSPEPRCELVYHTPFQLLAAVVLSAQATDRSVNKATTDLYAERDNNGAYAFTPSSVVNMGEAQLLTKIRTIGLAPTKARNLVRLSALLLERHGGEVPRNRESLEALPGVGRKTASVVLGELWGEKTIAVDTHVFRVTQRLGLQNAKNADQCADTLEREIAPQWLPTAHHWFILHGRYTCTARAPKCDACTLSDLCDAPDKKITPARP